MPRTENRLTDAQIRAAKPKEKPYALPDGGGLALIVSPAGGRSWRQRYRWQGAEQNLSLGPYPAVSLAQARERRTACRFQMTHGYRPIAVWRDGATDSPHTFKSIAETWLAVRMREVEAGQLAAPTVERDRRQLEKWVFPELGAKAINAVTRADLRRALLKIEAAGRQDTVYRTRETCERVFRFAKAHEHVTDNPAAAELFEGAFASRVTKHYAAIVEPKKVGQLLRAIEGYTGTATTRAALRMLAYTFVRPGELRQCEWSEVDLKAAEWRIPASKMKMRDAHIVPLAKQVVRLLREQHKISGEGKFVFPAIGRTGRSFSANTLNAALRALGYSSKEHVAHGFRSTASTLLNARGVNSDLIELQLAHRPRDPVRAIYNRATRLPERRKMMQAWSDYLDELRALK